MARQTRDDDVRGVGLDGIDLRTDVPQSARIYDYMLGGKDNFMADRMAAEAIAEDLPNLRSSMRANRRFLARVARRAATEFGMRQFLDIGAGLPTAPNLHEVVHEIDPESRVVYVDNDPLVLVHARALLAGVVEGRAAYVDGDLHEPAAIFESPGVTGTFDMSQPIAVTMLAVLQFVEDDVAAKTLVDAFVDPLASGSLITISTVTGDVSPDEVERGVLAYRSHSIPNRARSRAEVEALLAGLDLVEPGVVLVHRWRPDRMESDVTDEQVYMYGAMAIKR